MVRLTNADGDVRLGRTATGHDAPGRGAWLCSIECFDRAVKRRAFDRAWRRRADDAVLSEARQNVLIAFETTTGTMRDSSTGGDVPPGATPRKG
jgi:predicted RNA-binding protein YlxR (DUF448 family)